jgi:hypothetical protein
MLHHHARVMVVRCGTSGNQTWQPRNHLRTCFQQRSRRYPERDEGCDPTEDRDGSAALERHKQGPWILVIKPRNRPSVRGSME